MLNYVGSREDEDQWYYVLGPQGSGVIKDGGKKLFFSLP